MTYQENIFIVGNVVKLSPTSLLSHGKITRKFLVWQATFECSDNSKHFIASRSMETKINKECLQKCLPSFFKTHYKLGLLWPDSASCNSSHKSLQCCKDNNIIILCPRIRILTVILKSNLINRY